MVSTKKFNYNVKDKQFVAELSDLEDSNKELAWERVYTDACDLGLTIVSENTGKYVTFVINESKYDDEGDLLYYVLGPTAKSMKEVPECKGLSMILFND